MTSEYIIMAHRVDASTCMEGGRGNLFFPLCSLGEDYTGFRSGSEIFKCFK
jgi:hypothetical protein